jgi:predicted nucleotidyltransferase
MIQLIEKNELQLFEVCQKYSVEKLYLFGSAVTDQFTDSSDIDLAVVFKNTLSPIERGEAYFELLEALENLFNRKVDLVSYEVVKNPIFKEELDKTKLTLYAAA